jgi:hypothetical protein
MRHDCITALQVAGIEYPDALALRRISMTLHRWHELECGDGNGHSSWTIARGHFDTRESRFWNGEGDRPKPTFVYDDAGKPYIERHLHAAGGKVTYTLVADRERGALKRLGKIMARYPTLTPYVQGDPRGASLYILRPADMIEGADIGSYYCRGVAVYK